MTLREYTPYYKRILSLALPVILSQAGQLTTQFADTAMVGHFGGDNPVPLAAVSIGSSLFLIIFLASLGLSLAITPMVGEHYARGDKHEVSRIFQNSILYCIIIGVVATIGAIALRPFISTLNALMSSSGEAIAEVTDMALPYYDMLVWSLIPLMIFLAIKQFLEGIGNTKVAMWITLSGNILNIALNYIFIFGECGCEAMGAEGAGLATLISRLMQMVVMVGYLYMSKRLSSYRKLFTRGNTALSYLRRLTAIGFPISFQMVLESAAFILTSILALSFGAEAAGAMQVTFNIANVAWMITVAIGSASTIVVSHTYGAKERHKLRPTINATYHLGIAWAMFMATLFITLRHFIAELFTSNVEIIELTSDLMLLIAIYQLSDAIQGLSISMMRGLQDVKVIMPIVTCSYLLLNIPVGTLLAYHFDMGCEGLVIGLIVGLSSAAILTAVRLRRQTRLFESGKI